MFEILSNWAVEKYDDIVIDEHLIMIREHQVSISVGSKGVQILTIGHCSDEICFEHPDFFEIVDLLIVRPVPNVIVDMWF